MAQERSKTRRRRDLPEFGERLSGAISKAGLSDAEVSRVTGISRSVLIGYKAGRTLPGAAEIWALCQALKVSPNELLTGTETPFERDPLREALGL